MRRSSSGKHMKKTQATDARRNITRQIVSYLSIIVIAALAVSAYLGIEFTGKAVSNNGTKFYTETNYRDVEIISTKLVTPEDLEAIRAVQGVADVEGSYKIGAKVFLEDVVSDVNVVSLTERINTVQVIAGRLPQAPNECVLEKYVDEELGLTIGDTIEVLDAFGETPSYITRSEYIITGIVYHPDHAAVPLITPGTRYVLVMPEVFDTEALENCFMTAEVVIEKPAGIDLFSDKYFKTIQPTLDRLDALAKERELIRADYIEDRYETGINDGQTELDNAWGQLTDGRTELDNGWEEYNKGVAELTDAEKQLADAKKQLDDAEAQLADAKAQLDDAKEQLDSAKAQLDDAKAQLADAESQLADAKAKLDEGKAQLESIYQKIEEAKEKVRNSLREAIVDNLGEDVANMINWAKIDDTIDVDSEEATATILRISEGITVDLNKSLKDNVFAIINDLGLPEEDLRAAYEKTTNKILELAEDEPVIDAIVRVIIDASDMINEKYEEFASAARQWDEGHSSYISALSQYREAKEKYDNAYGEYENGLSMYYDGKSQYDDAVTLYDEGYAQYESGLSQYEEGLKAYEEGKTKLDDALVQLNDGEDQYADGLVQYNDGQTKLQDAKDEMANLDGCKWVLLGVNGNTGYLNVDNVVKNMSDLGAAFASVFVLVGALVIYATVGRIIDEQKRLVGATKALGLFNHEIFAKYLIFGETGTFVGMIIGAIAGYMALQIVILNIYDKNFVFDNAVRAIHYPYAVAVLIGGLLLAGFAVWFACTTLLKSSAITLMQDSVPGIKKKSSKKKKAGKGSLYAKLILFNMLTDMKRVAVTIVSIAGCCTLLVAGVTMKLSVERSINTQYTQIEVYNIKVLFDSSISENAESDIGEILKESGVTYAPVSDESLSYEANGAVRLAEVVCGDMDQINEFFVRTDPKTKNLITEAGDGIWVHNKFAKTNNVKVGDMITFYDSSMNPHQVKVCGIYKNHVGLYAFMSRETYAGVFGKEPVNNTYLVKSNGIDLTELSDKVSKVNGFTKIYDIDKQYENIMVMAKPLNLIALILSGIAGLMALFILLNLVNMYVNQKKKELTIMRINGFTVKETIRYVSLELIVCTMLGIVIGLGTGALLGCRVLGLLEGANLHLTKSVQPVALIVAALITSVYSFLVSAWALRKVKHLKLNEE